MRKLAALASLTSTLVALPAFAQESGLYVGGELGVLVSSETDQTYTPGATVGSTGGVSTDHDLGFTGSASVGYRFGAFRVEIEAGFQSADVDKVKSNFASGVTLASGSQDADGEISARTLMANATFDVGSFSDFTFFVGGGAGVADLKVSGLVTATGSSPVLDDKDDRRFAWQGTAGVRKPLASNIDMHVRYRYFSIDDAEMVGFAGRSVTAEFTSHALLAGASYRF
jgi:OOP family OmpA-OmpF porin